MNKTFEEAVEKLGKIIIIMFAITAFFELRLQRRILKTQSELYTKSQIHNV